MIIMLASLSLVVDFGNAYLNKAEMQKAADAASLAAVRELPYTNIAQSVSYNYASFNGFAHGIDSVSVYSYPHDINSNWYVVEIHKDVKHILAPIIGFDSLAISVKSVSEFNAYIPINISGDGEYGANGTMTLSMFGPYGYYSYGDAFSPRWLNNGDKNPTYRADGYDFILDVPDNYYQINGTNAVKLEIFDPDTWNNGGDNAYPGLRIDEIRYAPSYPHPQPSNIRNTTEYTLFAPDSTPNDYSDDVQIAKAIYGPEVSWTDMKWVSPDGFEFSTSDFGTGKYRINIKATDGSSENGFNLRAGPPSGDFDPDNGTSVTALGALPLNFNDDGMITVTLGNVPAEAAGKKMHINKFDTDVGAKSIVYRCDTLPGDWAGLLSGDGTWKEDILTLPSDYSGGTWTATYYAGLQDTSVWTMWFEGMVAGQPGFVRLVE